MSTKADLLESWVRWTGDDVAEARHRIRALSEAGLLPVRQEAMGYDHVAQAVLGFTAADQHKDAAEAVLSFANFLCSTSSPLHHVLQHRAEAWAAEPIGRVPLLAALTAALSPPFWVKRLEVNTTTKVCRLTIGHGYHQYDGVFTETDQPASERLLHPIQVTRTICFDLINRLLIDLNMGILLPAHQRQRAPGTSPAKGVRGL